MAKLSRCPNGHFYDMERSPQCPYCGGQSGAGPTPPNCPGEEEFRARLAEQEAQARARGVTADLPPADGADAGKTVPLREEAGGKTQPLNNAGMDRTQPLYDSGADRTQPLGKVPMAPPPPRREADWQRALLLAAAGLAAACTLFSLIDLMRWL